ncbi:hypothetical protein BCR36DRAFT_314920 [Piromyces finnis]|uniref:Cas1p 10 TM acyl transferase domain-containing protein n=1 Tax=Piromyces finnis TaxID=1754191 RepID=A0A1Y1VNE1_9FUNG|nr:hypothetical protein BCR36DRAFT_314920 [Piromyces finnis]|eukprot:ORX60919.1 hypothetical protein BCR36DRAFT_314920 [Piromyces finnis]
MSENNLDIPILNGNNSISKKNTSMSYFQTNLKSNSSQNVKLKKFLNISFIFCTTISFIFSMYGIHQRKTYDIHDNNSCSALINNGHWISVPSKNNSHWQPDTCVIKNYEYDVRNIKTCLKDTNVNFIGDITISRLFQYLESIAFGSITSNDDIKNKKTIEIKKETTRLIYHQDNYFDSEYFNQLLTQYSDPNIRNIFVLSSGKSIINTYLNPDTNEIDDLELEKAKSKWTEKFLKTLVRIQRTNHEYYIRLLTPVLNLDDEKPLAKKIVEWNEYITQITEDIREKDTDGKGKIHVPLSWNKLYFDSIQNYDESNRDIFIKNIIREELNLFLNSICNEKINATDSTCCINYPKNNFKQDIIFVLLFVFGPLSLCYRKFIQKYYLVPPSINKFIPDDELVMNLTTLALTVYFSFIIDNTALFLKENKQYSLLKSIILLIIISIPIINSIDTSKNTSMLNSEQVNEWQGITTILYLIVHYFNDNEGDLSNNFSRVIISCYMFLIGYTNYDYYNRKGNFEFINFVYYILKKITLPLVLSFALGGSIIDYFFPIMNAFWSIIIFSTMGILASFNNNKKVFLIKLGSAIFITFIIFNLLPFVTKYLFILFGIIFGVKWDYIKWHNDISMDFWTVWMGVLFSYLLSIIYESDGLHVQKFKVSTLNIIGIVGSICISIISIPTILLSSKSTYNNIHPWLSSFIPIAYIIIRNSHHMMRKRISKFLCWIGSISMEIYILYNHFLISSNTHGHGIIIYIPNSFWLNLCVSCIILIWTSFIMNHTLTKLCRWMINSLFNLSLSSNAMYNQLTNNNSTVHFDVNGSANFASNSNINKDEPSTSNEAPIASNNNEESKESSLDNLLNNSNQENLTTIQDTTKDTLQSIQYRWLGLFLLLWIINAI